jgi:hypothetical protein
MFKKAIINETQVPKVPFLSANLCDSDNFVGCILTSVGWLSEMETDTLRALLKDI